MVVTRRGRRAGRAAPTCVDALAALLRPQGRPAYADGIAAGVAIAGPLVFGARTGHPGIGATAALCAVLMAMPLPPGAGTVERARHLAARGLWVTAAGIYVASAGRSAAALAPGVAAAAFAGALLPRVGTTAALAVLLFGITGEADNPPQWPGLVQAAGCAWTALLLLPRPSRARPAGDGPGQNPRAAPGPGGTTGADGHGPAPADPHPAAPPRARGRPFRHAARTGTLTGVVTAVTGWQGSLWGQGHWLVTSLLLSLRPTRRETRTKAVKRLVGNALGGVVAALLLLCRPEPAAVAVLVGISGTVAYTFRPANYAYWSLASPVLLLLLSDYDSPLPWWAAVVRVGMVLSGGAVAVLASRWLWPGQDDT
ncbi:MULTISPECIES: FUSC family protein [Streptomyces]|uniref:FUSC family protein n=1 Tax=Streptomyces TaxID=1883 RepID=UPI00345BD4AC